jgi:endonuclease/exonuclease/phosphatase family metal-dependent hydrolase
MKRLAGLTETVEATAVFWFFYQALRILFSMLFGLLYDALFAGRASMTTVGLFFVGLLVAALTPLVVPRRRQALRTTLLVGAVLVFLGRMSLSLDHPQGRLVASLIVVAAASLYLAAKLRAAPGDVPRALVMALVIDQGVRAAGHTWDVTLQPSWWLFQILISLALCALAGWLSGWRPIGPAGEDTRVGLGLGLLWGSWLFLQMSLLAFPNAMARWSGESYLLFALSWPFVLLLTFLGEELWQTRRGLIDGVLLLIILLAGLALGYLLTGPLAFLGLLLAQLASLVALFSCLPIRCRNQADRLGPALALGNLLFLLFGFAYAFTFTYPYTLQVFRGLGLAVFLVAGLLAALPALRHPPVDRRPRRPSPARWFTVWGSAALVVCLILIVPSPCRRIPPAEGEPLRAATYNIHYGYDTDWHLSLEAQAKAIEASGAGLVMLQEVDTGRPTSYMIDDAMWLACRLDMEAAYLPTMEHLTGIALLSRYPILDTETALLPSDLEQTGIIWARLDVGGSRREAEPAPVAVNAFATWLGLEPEERARQLDATLPFLAAHGGPAAFGGDLNSTPESPIYARIAAAGFVDPFAALGLGSPPTDPAIEPHKRIDFVWLRDLEPARARVVDSVASDHRPVVVEALLP